MEQENYTPYKVKLEFDMPMARDDLTLALYGQRAFWILHDLDQHLRTELKHGEYDEGASKTMERVREYIRDCMEAKNISFDMVE